MPIRKRRVLKNIRLRAKFLLGSKNLRKSLFDSGTLNRSEKRQLQLIGDAGLIVACFILAVIFRGDAISILTDPWVWAAVLPMVPATLIVFDRLGLYRAVLRYITGTIMRIIIPGVVVGSGVLLALSVVLQVPVPIGLVLIHAMMVLLSISGMRFWIRAMIRKPSLRDMTPVVIYGAGHAGRQLVAALHLGMEPARGLCRR